MELKRHVIDEIPEEMYDVLKEIGIPVHMEGYDYIAYACMMLIDDPRRSLYVTKDIYPQVAKVFHTRYSSVDRAIRSAVTWMLDNVDPDVLYDCFGNSISIDCKMTNSQFLYTLSRVARRKIIRSQSA